MQIIVTPNDIIQRCLWDKYKRFCLHDKNEEEIKNVVESNKPISLNENDAYVIGLLKIIETDNLIHRFNDDIFDFLQIKSSIIKDDLYISKYAINKFVSSYYDKFPDYYEPNVSYKKGLNDLRDYIKVIEGRIDNLETITIKNRDKLFTYFISKDIKKILDT
jgi:hypothetical protein